MCIRDSSLSIAADAAIGPRDISITNQKGTTDPLKFAVTPPTWPDLALNVKVPPVLGSSWEETFVIGVRNVGTAATTAPVTVKRDFNLQFTHTTSRFISYSGEGWTCTFAENRFMTCTNPLSIACLLYTSDAADERSSVDLGGRRIIKKKKTN